MSEFTGTRVLVGIDGSPAGSEAMMWAADEARLRGVPLVLTYAGDTGEGSALSPETGAAVRKESTDYGHQLIADAIATLADSHPTVPVRRKLESAHPASLLIDSAKPDDLVVVGRTHGSAAAIAVLGSVSRRVTAHGTTSVVVVGDVPDDPDSPVVVGVSASAGGIQAMRFACTEARLHGTSVLGVRAWSVHDWSVDSNGSLSHELWSEAQEAVLRVWVRRATAEFPDVVVETTLTHLPVYQALLTASSKAQLLVLGCRRPDDSVLPRLGPIATWVVENAECPSAVVDRGAGDDEVLTTGEQS